MKNLNKFANWIALGGMLFACSAPSVRPQRAERRPRIWETRARNITDSLLADLPQLEKNDKAMLLARLGQLWSKRDPPRARKWFTLAVETLETAPTDKSEVACQRGAAVVLLGIISGQNRALADRLAAIIETPKKGQNESERLENAKALIEAGMAVLTPDPQAAEKFGENSLSLGFSNRLGSLLTHLYISNPSEGEKLFSYVLSVAKSKSDYDLFRVLVNQVFNGPFTADKYRKLLLGTLADAIAEIERSGNSAAFCNQVPLLQPFVADFDRLLPEFSQQVRGHIQRCQQLRPDPPKPAQETHTIDDVIRAGHDADNPTDRIEYLEGAAHLAANEEDFDRAVDILDSMEEADKTRAGDDWESWRWNYATAAACNHRKKDDLQTVNKIIDDTPQKLRGFLRITLASTCESTTPAETLDLLASARKDLEKVAPSQQAYWYLALMRVYAKVSPDVALEVLSQTIAAINNTAKERQINCKTTARNPPVLSTFSSLRDYEIPMTLLETDEAGVLNAIKSVQPADIRAALRLQLLTIILDQLQKPDKGTH